MTDDTIIQVFYNGYLLEPNPNISYSMDLVYNNDIVSGYSYTVNLKGYCIADQGSVPSANNSVNELVKIKNIFSSNGGYLEVIATDIFGNISPILYATNALVQKISFPENNNSWSRYIEYNIELKCSHLFIGLKASENIANIIYGNENSTTTNNLSSPFSISMSDHKIENFTESFDLETGENQVARTSIFDNFNQITNSLGGEYFTIKYTVNATGKHEMKQLNFDKRTLPAWENAKRFVHSKLLQQMGSLFENFLNVNGKTTREFINSNIGPGTFGNFTTSDFFIYNEHFDFQVSESDGTFGVTYNAIIKRVCPINTSNTIGCRDNVLHTFNKQINYDFNANEETNTFNRDIEITINGTITGLVPGGILLSGSRLNINNVTSGSFLVYNTSIDQFGLGAGGGIDKNYSADLAMRDIFDYDNFDFYRDFKELVGVTPEALAVSPTATMRPSKVVVTRNPLNGTISYTATYNNKFNCDPNNFEIQLSTKEPNPVIAPFTIPNNNLSDNRDADGNVCLNSRGYDIIQLLGTQTPRTIDVTINGNVSLDFNRCCFGTSDNWNIFDYDFARLTDFAIPNGVNIPYISENYVLTKKSKSITYPKGSMNISLSYICADVCEIDDYFKDIPVNRQNNNIIAN